MMVNNSTDIKKTKNHVSPEITKHKKDPAIWRGKYR